MRRLTEGEYTGKISRKRHVEDCIVTSISYNRNESDTDWHYHDNMHLCFVLDKGRSDAKGQIKYSDTDGSIFRYRAGERHRWTSPAPAAKSLNIEISPTFLDRYNLTETSIYDHIDSKVDAKASMIRMRHELLDADAFAEAEIQHLLINLLVDSRGTSIGIPHWASQAKQLLHDNWNEIHSLDSLSRELNIHPVTISKNFQRYHGSSLGEYQRALKIEKSIHLIRNTSMSLTAIGLHCGFSDQSHFTRTFKKSTGLNPNVFRKL